MGLLLKYGANINATNVLEGKAALSDATISGGYDAVVFLVERGADINTSCSYADGYTPFSAASINNNKAIMYYLVRKGANITNELNKCLIKSFKRRKLLTMGILHHFGADESVLKTEYKKQTIKMSQRYYHCYEALITFMLCFNQIYKVKNVSRLVVKEIWNTRKESYWDDIMHNDE